MSKWRKSDIGKIIVYRGKTSPDERVVIYDIDSRTPNTIGFVEYPISLNSKISFPFLSSKLGCVGIIKSQKKESEGYLEKAGDWCFVGKVSKDERKVLEIIAKTPKNLSDIW